jgi:hypothetical protein
MQLIAPKSVNFGRIAAMNESMSIVLKASLVLIDGSLWEMVLLISAT